MYFLKTHSFPQVIDHFFKSRVSISSEFKLFDHFFELWYLITEFFQELDNFLFSKVRLRSFVNILSDHILLKVLKVILDGLNLALSPRIKVYRDSLGGHTNRRIDL